LTARLLIAGHRHARRRETPWKEDVVDLSNAEREIATLDNLMNRTGRLHIRGINGARGWAAEALGNVLWQVPEAIGKAWLLLERRAIEEPLISVRCCLMRPTVALYNDDPKRCAALAERLSRSPMGANQNPPTLLEKAWHRLAFPAERLPRILKQTSVWCGGLIERLVRKHGVRLGDRNELKWWLPLLTHQGVYLIPFLLQSVPAVGKRLIYRLVVCGDETSRMFGAWHIFGRSFQDAQYSPLADAFADDGVIYRRLIAEIASQRGNTGRVSLSR
jgi:hypothetical protein